jgi:hypothetical protein
MDLEDYKFIPLIYLLVIKYCPNIIRMIKPRRMRWAGHVAVMVERRNACRILVRKPEVKRPLRRPRRSREDNIIWILERQDGVVWTGLIWFRIGTSDGLL